MTSRLLHMRSATSSSVPVAANLQNGQLAINIADGRLFTKNASGLVVKLADAVTLADTYTLTAANSIGAAGISAIASNIDTLGSTGCFFVPVGTSGTLPSGYTTGTLQVINNSTVNGIIQNFMPLIGISTILTRRYVSGAWSAWVPLLNPLNLGNYAVQSINGQRADTTGNILVSEERNKVVNPTYAVWQRAVPASGAISAFIADHWYLTSNGATVSQGIGGIPDEQYYLNYQETAGTGTPVLSQSIESCRTLQNRYVTLSFMANVNKALTMTPTLTQNFGVSGSISVPTAMPSIAMTVGWQRYITTVQLPSVTGKTIGTADDYLKLAMSFGTAPGAFTFQITQVQLEEGPYFMGFEYRKWSDVQNDCFYFFERILNGVVGYSGYLTLLSTASFNANFTYKRKLPVVTPTVLTTSGFSGTPTIAATTRQGVRLQTATLLSLGVASTTMNLDVDAELPVL